MCDELLSLPTISFVYRLFSPVQSSLNYQLNMELKSIMDLLIYCHDFIVCFAFIPIVETKYLVWNQEYIYEFIRWETSRFINRCVRFSIMGGYNILIAVHIVVLSDRKLKIAFQVLFMMFGSMIFYN